MNVAWSDLWAAIALLLILEGIMPFLAPGAFRETLRRLSETNERTLRKFGAVWIALGLALLYWTRG